MKHCAIDKLNVKHMARTEFRPSPTKKKYIYKFRTKMIYYLIIIHKINYIVAELILIFSLNRFTGPRPKSAPDVGFVAL